MLRKKKFLIGGIIVFLAIGFLVYRGIGGSPYFLEVGELLEQQSSVHDQNIRVNGLVAPGSIEQENGGLILRFTINDTQTEASLPVVYQGVVPDTFKAGNEVVVEGHLNSDGIFQGHTLMAQCASRYVPAK